ncbi:hypothetical protein V496_08809 [Pseudogymnoascus sp. VKM F-4515 (FW-2607)]|nr:hypothetical protein V496_08809 [Pseudogymnoascus sp. VKM F-4515 (FW-2607)]
MYRPPRRRLTFERRFTMSSNNTITTPSEPAPPTTQSTTELPTTSVAPPPTTTSQEPPPTTTSDEVPPTTTSEDPTTTAEEPPTSTPPTSTGTDDNGGGGSKTTITIPSTASRTNTPTGTTTGPPATSSTDPSLNDGNSGSGGGGGGGLTGAGRTAVAVVVPIVAVALLALLALWFWRRRKQRKDAEELRRKEVEEYGYNPNNDPTLPAIGMVGGAGSADNGPREEESGYRGWGTTSNNMSSGRKASTTMSGGAAGAYSEGANSQAPVSDTRSDNALVGGGRPHSDEVEQLGAMGPSASANRGGDIHRGVSNASSSYSAGHASDNSDEQAVPGGAYGAAQYYSNDGPYADPAYGGRGGPVEAQGQPVIRDNLARRATRIENPSHFPTQASAGISQNF